MRPWPARSDRRQTGDRRRPPWSGKGVASWHKHTRPRADGATNKAQLLRFTPGMGTILTWYRNGGPLMLPLLVVGVAGLAVMLERFSYIVLRSRIHARPFIEKVLSLVRASRADE